jgi:hypothetical protein
MDMSPSEPDQRPQDPCPRDEQISGEDRAQPLAYQAEEAPGGAYPRRSLARRWRSSTSCASSAVFARLTWATNPSPLPHEQPEAKQIRLHVEPVKPSHVARGVDAMQGQGVHAAQWKSNTEFVKMLQGC